MEDSNRPPLAAEVCEEIEDSQYSVQKIYATKLNVFAEQLRDSSSMFGLGGGEGLRPPKRPIAIGKCLGAYAIALFDIESSFYPRSDGLPVWLEALARRVEQKIIAHVLSIGDSPMRAFFLVRLTYHASEQQMREAIRAALKTKMEGHPNPVRSIAPAEQSPSTEVAVPKKAIPYLVGPAPSASAHIPGPTNKQRLPATITSPIAARRMEAFLEAKGIWQTEFATQVGTTDRTLRSFRSSGKVKREIFDSIAAQMGLTREQLMKP
jgi:hypothetical protein